MNFLNVIIFFLFLTLIGILLICISYILSLKKYDLEKISAYECGFNAFNDARSGYYISFYLIALIYILFDIEITILIPFSLSLPYQTAFSFGIMIVFIVLLILGFIYEYFMGALEWK